MPRPRILLDVAETILELAESMHLDKEGNAFLKKLTSRTLYKVPADFQGLYLLNSGIGKVLKDKIESENDQRIESLKQALNNSIQSASTEIKCLESYLTLLNGISSLQHSFNQNAIKSDSVVQSTKRRRKRWIKHADMEFSELKQVTSLQVDGTSSTELPVSKISKLDVHQNINSDNQNQDESQKIQKLVNSDKITDRIFCSKGVCEKKLKSQSRKIVGIKSNKINPNPIQVVDEENNETIIMACPLKCRIQSQAFGCKQHDSQSEVSLRGKKREKFSSTIVHKKVSLVDIMRNANTKQDHRQTKKMSKQKNDRGIFSPMNRDNGRRTCDSKSNKALCSNFAARSALLRINSISQYAINASKRSMSLE